MNDHNRFNLLGLTFLGLAILSSPGAAQSNSQPYLAVMCAKLDLAVQGSLDDNPVAEHLPSNVRAMAARYQMAARRECASGQAGRAFERYETALALLGQPWVMRNIILTSQR